ncbi:MAG: MmcQ/YjbR family DNA-binding protein [Acidimicrobiia bacterium]|nr:MmcQ/YjbR family DNA-binding protein [Acidimicrobiia bacterium]
MNIEWVQKHCLALPHTTEQVQWEDHLLFKIGGKMYAVLPLSPGGNFLSLKADPEEFADLVEIPGVIPAPYLARAKWVALERSNTLPRHEIKRLLDRAYDTVLGKLPKKAQARLRGG